MAKKLYEETDIQAIASAIRGKCGTTCGYKVCDMAEAINSITAGSGEGAPVIESKTITANGTYTAPTGVDGYNPITVNVPTSASGSKYITKNGTYNVAAYATAVVDTPGITPEGMRTITSNGLWDVSTYEIANVEVPSAANLISKTITVNGTFNPSDDGADGYSSVLVNVPTTGITPSGTLTVTSNGTVNVTNYAYADIQVPTGGSVVGAESILDKTISGTYSSSTLDYVGPYAFYGCSNLTGINLPNVTLIDSKAFYTCRKLRTINLPNVIEIMPEAFESAGFDVIDLPSVTSIGYDAFSGVIFNERIPSAFIIRTTNCEIGRNAFGDIMYWVQQDPDTDFGWIYVPRSAVNTYKTAANWSTYASRIRAIEDYPEICG